MRGGREIVAAPCSTLAPLHDEQVDMIGLRCPATDGRAELRPLSAESVVRLLELLSLAPSANGMNGAVGQHALHESNGSPWREAWQRAEAMEPALAHWRPSDEATAASMALELARALVLVPTSDGEVSVGERAFLALADKIRRLHDLETRFQSVLEQEKLASLAEFAAGAGHEINNPLAVISGRAQLLLQQERDPDRRRDLAIMHAQALRVHEMIADLMLFARPPQPRWAPVDVGQLAAEAVASLSELADERHVRLADLRDAPHVPATLDRQQVVAALQALIRNAIEASPRGACVDLSLAVIEGPPRQARITVRDHGSGISPEIRRHLFDPFFSGRAAGRGLGTGLSKAWRIAQMLGGSIDVECPEDGGACFSLTLPIERPA